MLVEGHMVGGPVIGDHEAVVAVAVVGRIEIDLVIDTIHQLHIIHHIPLQLHIIQRIQLHIIHHIHIPNNQNIHIQLHIIHHIHIPHNQNIHIQNNHIQNNQTIQTTRSLDVLYTSEDAARIGREQGAITQGLANGT